MGSGVKWLFELYDKVSSPAKAMTKSLERVDKAVDAVDKHSKHAQGALDVFAHHVDKANEKVGKELLEGVAGKFAVFNIGLQLAEKFLETVAEIGAELAHEAVEAANFGRETEIVFTSLLGSSEKAQELGEYIERWGSAAGVSHSKVRDVVDDLVRAGFEGKNLNVLNNAAFDVEALTFGKTSAKQISEAFLDISEKGQLTSRSLMQFRGVLGENGADKLAAKLGFATHGIKALQKQLEETPVDAFKGEQAILDVIEQMSGGKLGATREKLSHELPGIIEKFKGNVESLFTTVGKSAAWTKFLSFAERFANAFDPATESGKKFEAAIDRVLVGVEGLLDKVGSPDEVDNIITKMTEFADSAATVARAVISITEALAKVIGWWNDVPAPLRSFLSNPFTAAPRAVGNWLTGVVSRGGAAEYDSNDYGHTKAFYENARAKGGVEDDAAFMSIGADAFDGIEKGFRDAGKIQSPSRVMFELGQNAFEGLHQGAERSSSSSSGGTLPPITVQIVNHINGGAASAEEIGHEVAKQTASELQAAFDTLAEQMGLVPV